MVGMLAGVAGFEPANAGTKNRCLTTWRHPSRPSGERPYSFENPVCNLDAIDPAIIVGRSSALDVNQPVFQFLSQLSWPAAANGKGEIG
jgi:hypothetical protein